MSALVRGEKAAFVRLQENLGQIFSNLSDGLLLFDQQDRLVLATPSSNTETKGCGWTDEPRTGKG